MFLINGQPLAIDTPFTDINGTQYPANWLRFATTEEKSVVGITEVADEDNSFDNRFYWSKDLPKALNDREESDEAGNPLYVQVLGEVDGQPAMVDTTERLVTKGLKSNFISQIKNTAGSILAQTDWYITRKAEIGTEVPSEIAIYRAAVRVKADELEIAINNVTTVEELANLNLSFPSK